MGAKTVCFCDRCGVDLREDEHSLPDTISVNPTCTSLSSGVPGIFGNLTVIARRSTDDFAMDLCNICIYLLLGEFREKYKPTPEVATQVTEKIGSVR